MQQTEKKETAVPLEPDKTQLRRTMGLRATVALGIGGTIGGAIFILVGKAIYLAGPGALFSFGLAFLAAVLIALPYAELACRYPLAGGGYASVQAILGRHWGFLMGWTYVGSWLFICGYIVLGFGNYLHVLFNVQPIEGALALIVGIVALNLIGRSLFSRVQSVIVLLVVTALIGYGIVGLPHIKYSYFSPFFPHGMRGILAVAPLAFLALAGFEIVATTGEEVEQPKRNLPLAILLTLGTVLMLYLLVIFVTTGLLPHSATSTSSVPLSDAVSFLGSIGPRLIAAVAALTTAATANALLVATSRTTFAMARDGHLPRMLAYVSPSARVPRIAIIVNGIILALVPLSVAVNLLSAKDAVELFSSAGSFLYVLHFFFPLIALVVLRQRDKTSSTFQTPAPHLILPLAFGACLLLMYATGQYPGGQKGIGGGLSWLIGGLFVYASIQAITFSLRRRFYLKKKGYVATLEEISVLRNQIHHMLKQPHTTFEQLLAIQVKIGELKQMLAIQAWIEEVEQMRISQARIEELKLLRATQARIEELGLLRQAQASIEEFKLQRVAQIRVEEFEQLQIIQIQPAQLEERIVLGDGRSETLR